MLSAKQARAFLSAATTDRLGALFALAITAGLRPGEYLALKWTDLGGWEFADTKRPRSRRTIKLQSHVVAALEAHKEAQDEQRREAEKRWTEHDLVFTTRTGGPTDERNLAQQDFVRILEAAKLPTSFRLYDPRHTAATLALEAGVQPKVVSEMPGHASAAFTLDVYSHVLPHMQDSSAAKVEALLMKRSHGSRKRIYRRLTGTFCDDLGGAGCTDFLQKEAKRW